MSFGKHVRQLRQLRGLSRKQLVERLQSSGLHVSDRLVSQIERDSPGTVVTDPLVAGMAVALEVDRQMLAALAAERVESHAAQPATVAADGQPAPRSFKEDMQQVGSVGKWLLILLLSNSVSAVVLKAADSGGLDEGGLQGIISLFKLTAPLTVSVAIMGIAVLRGWLDDAHAMVSFILAGVVLYAATWLGNTLGQPATPIDPWRVLYDNPNPFNFVLAMVVHFFGTYGWWKFLQSVAVGCFLAWTGARMMWPHAERLVRAE